MIKLVRKWGYKKKNLAGGTAEIAVVNGNFHGRTTGIISFCTDSSSTDGFGPMMPGYQLLPYNDVNAIERLLARNPAICGFYWSRSKVKQGC